MSSSVGPAAFGIEGVFNVNLYVFINIRIAYMVDLSVWSRGMIPPLGGGGPGFKSRNGPWNISFLQFLVLALTILHHL